MSTYSQVIFFSLIGGVFSLIGGVLLISRKKTANILAAYATPFAAGALLAAVFLDLLKDGLEQADQEAVLYATLLGILIFFFAERFLRWFHHHHQHGSADPSVNLIIIGDTVHNAMDGVAIASAFLISVPTGIITTVAVAAHEIPQEIGDFGLLLAKGLRRRTILLVNILSALSTTALAIITFSLGSKSDLPIGWLLGISAGFLLYLALSDVIPVIHEKSSSQRLFGLQPLLLILGVLAVGVSAHLAHKYIDVEHANDSSQSHSHDNYADTDLINELDSLLE